MSDKPNPGSDDAIKIGCSCPVIDNCHGRGYMGGGLLDESGNTVFVINCDCPVHFCGDDDPSPYCQYCMAMTKEQCTCGPIADNH